MSLKLKSLLKKQILHSTSQASISKKEDPPLKNGKNRQLNHNNNKKDETRRLCGRSTKRRQRTALGMLEDIIKYPICKEILQNPEELECQHIFCKKYLEMELKKENFALQMFDSGFIVRCPICCRITRVSLESPASISRFLRAIDGKFVKVESENGLIVNFGDLKAEQCPIQSNHHTKYDTNHRLTDRCRHCQKVFKPVLPVNIDLRRR